MVFLKGYMVLNTCLEGGKGRKEEFETKEENFPLMIKKKYPQMSTANSFEKLEKPLKLALNNL